MPNHACSAPTIFDINKFADQYPGLPSNAIITQAVQGDVLAQHELGNRLANGSDDFPVNASAAATWYSRAAQRGFPGNPSLDALPNFSIRIDRTKANVVTAAPVAHLAKRDSSLSLSLTQTPDGSATCDGQHIYRVIRSIAGMVGNDAEMGVTPSELNEVFHDLPILGVAGRMVWNCLILKLFIVFRFELMSPEHWSTALV